MKPVITTRWVSLGFTMLTKDGTNQFVLNPTSHHVTTLPTDVQMFLLNYGNQLQDNRLLGPWSVVLLI